MVPGTLEVVKKVAPFMGIPWQERGDSFKGCDCQGLVKLFFQTLFGDPDCTKAKWLRVTTPHPFDTVVFNKVVPARGRLHLAPLHVGILVLPTTVLHTDKGLRSGLERIDNDQLGSMIEGYYRHPLLRFKHASYLTTSPVQRG